MVTMLAQLETNAEESITFDFYEKLEHGKVDE